MDLKDTTVGIDIETNTLTGRAPPQFESNIRFGFSRAQADEVKGLFAPLPVGYDYGALELRILAGLLAEAQQTGAPSLKEAAASLIEQMPPEDLFQHLIKKGEGTNVVVAEEPPPETHRAYVEGQLEKVPTRILKLLGDWAALGEHNRKERRRKAAIAKRLRKHIPKTVSLVEAAAVL